jgi:DNA primase
MDYVSLLRHRGMQISDKRTADHVFMPCMFHGDTNPSLEVNVHDGRWYCFGCRQGGGFAKLLAEIDGIPIAKAKELLESDFDAASTVDSIERMVSESTVVMKYLSKRSFREVFVSLEGTPGESYLESRGISLQFARSRGLRWAESGKYAGRVIMPMFTPEGNLVSYAGRAVSPSLSPKIKNGKVPVSRYFYGLYEQVRGVCRLPYVCVVEGPFDALYLQQRGVYAIANNGVHRCSRAKLAALMRYTDKVVLMFDGDAPGISAAQEWYAYIGKFMPVLQVQVPKDRDPAELTNAEVAGMRSMIERYVKNGTSDV